MENLYVYPFIKSFFASVLLTSLFVFLLQYLKKRGFARSNYLSRGLFRIGGVAIIISFLFNIINDGNLYISNQLLVIIFVSLIILFSGLLDDFLGLNWKNQLLLQISFAILIFIFGIRVEYITNPFGGILFLDFWNKEVVELFFLIVWMLLIINSMNWLDGLDGLSGGVSLIGAMTIFFLSLKPEVNQPPMAIISIVFAGSLLGFLVYNFHPAKIFAGTSGSFFMGFILAVLAVFAGAKIATALLVMVIPITDAIWVIIKRIKSKASVFEKDRNHLHYKLIELGWSQTQIAVFYYVITIMIAIIALNTKTLSKFSAICSIVILMSVFLVMISVRTKKINKNKI